VLLFLPAVGSSKDILIAIGKSKDSLIAIGESKFAREIFFATISKSVEVTISESWLVIVFSFVAVGKRKFMLIAIGTPGR